MSARRRLPWLTAGLLAAALIVGSVAGTLAQEAGRSVAVSVAAPAERRLNRDDHPNHLFREQTATFGLAGGTYRIAYKACVDPAHGNQVAPLEGYLGMPAPCSCNWYHGGFLFVRINGRDIGLNPLSSMMVVETGERAILDLVWRDEVANVRARFIGLPGMDCLLCEVAIEPLAEITSVGIDLRCYPSYFTAHNRRDGARRIQTPSTLIEQGEDGTVPLVENWWAVYYDEIFDVAKGEGEGPCSVLIAPPAEGEIRFAPGSYAVSTHISLPAETRTVRMAFWDHRGLTNADALALVQEQAPAVEELLLQADFTPAAVTGFDAAEARAAVERALASEAARDALADRITQMQAWLETNAPAAGGAEPGVAAQEELLRSIDEYNSFKWEVQLIELLSEL